MLACCPQGFEENEGETQLELVAYVDEVGEDRLARVFGAVEARDVAPGWESAWKAFHRPVRIGPLWIGPPWLPPDEGALAVVIDPGQAFGTGSHPTTRLCVELLLGEARGSLADLGCGSGVLAIAAAKLGFEPVVALDLDPAAIEATQQNARANGVAVEARRADLLADPLPEADVALANLEAAVVGQVAARLPARRLIASGLLVSEQVELPGFRLLERREAGGWAAELRVRRP